MFRISVRLFFYIFKMRKVLEAMLKRLLFVLTILMIFSCETKKESLEVLSITKTDTPPVIDGKETDTCWLYTIWLPINQRWDGAPFSNNDFNGSYKLTWDAHALYLLVKIEDNALIDLKDSCDALVVWVDADNSGGKYTDSFNTFTYNLKLNGEVLSNDKSNQIQFKRSSNDHLSIWEVKIPLYTEAYLPEQKNTPITLQRNMKIGFAVAYSDVDTGNKAENLIGSALMPETQEPWLNADTFSTLLLK